ncbi:phosphotransferase [Paenibacillus aurantius]|uniref:Phosphotransferase n=1 Tax=Paenibacillus aurantius TaxID=2918900 RepID=A0AA96LCS3_9BACL|nr:phosphotransferase [Paenibacillus aurantius]WNQ10774.1 phosphotransferase [Paenibacillus aurantius]
MENLQSMITKQWQVKVSGDLRPVDSGTKNVTCFHDENGRPFYLKRKRGAARIAQEELIYHALSKVGISASYPIETVEGRAFTVFEGNRYCLYRPVPGTVVNGFDEKMTFQIGRSLALLHKGLLEINDHELFHDMNIKKQLTEWAIPVVLAEFGNSGAASAKDLFEELQNNFLNRCDTLPHQLIHRDPNSSNMLYAEDKGISFIDFELATYGLRIFDICYFSTGMLMSDYSNTDFRLRWFHLLDVLVKGYRSETPLTQAELDAVFYVIVSIQIIFSAYFSKINKDMALLNFDSLFWIERHKAKIQQVVGT